ncbi:MAG: HTTM domain-containing protein [Bdellovibrionota bacterium]
MKVFFTIYSYIFVIEKSYYNNHYYLIILLVFLLSLTNADAVWSLKKTKKLKLVVVPYWHVAIIQLQLVICYMGGAFAKFNWDWFRGEPMARFLSQNYDMPFIGQYFNLKPVIFGFAYGGMFFDLLIGPALLWRKTRLPAFFALIFFHFMNNNLFSIGVFPYLGIGSAVIFLEPETPNLLLEKLKTLCRLQTSKQDLKPTLAESFSVNTIKPLLYTYFIFQILLPFRHFLYSGNVSWTEEGHNFAWHMKLRAKQATAHFRLFDGIGKEYKINQHEFLNPKQALKMTTRPHMLMQFAKFLGKEFEKRGVVNPKVFVINPASLNGRPFQYLVKPDVDLIKVDDPWYASADWIEPLIAGQAIGNYNRSEKERLSLLREAVKIQSELIAKTNQQD